MTMTVDNRQLNGQIPYRPPEKKFGIMQRQASAQDKFQTIVIKVIIIIMIWLLSRNCLFLRKMCLLELFPGFPGGLFKVSNIIGRLKTLPVATPLFNPHSDKNVIGWYSVVFQMQIWTVGICKYSLVQYHSDYCRAVDGIFPSHKNDYLSFQTYFVPISFFILQNLI